MGAGGKMNRNGTTIEPQTTNDLNVDTVKNKKNWGEKGVPTGGLDGQKRRGPRGRELPLNLRNHKQTWEKV